MKFQITITAFLMSFLIATPAFAESGAAAYDVDNNGVTEFKDVMDIFLMHSSGGYSFDTDINLDGDTNFDDVTDWFAWIDNWDIDGDHTFSLVDVVLVQTEVNSGGNDLSRDVNHDGVITMADFYHIRNELVRSPWKRNNPGNGVDVNDDGFVTPLDAQIVATALFNGVGPSLEGVPKCRKPFLDVNGDKKLTVGDVAAVIFALNQMSGGSASGTGGGSVGN